MKGKIILQDISNPVEGMQIVPYGEGTQHFQYITEVQDDIHVRVNDQRDGMGFGIVRKISELKQIVVEYFEVGIKDEAGNSLGKYKTLPLHPEDWKVAIALIGHEINWEFGEGWDDIAKLILPTPVRSINDIPEELRKNYPEDYDFTQPEQWEDILEAFKNSEEYRYSPYWTIHGAFIRWLKKYYHAPKIK